jgi:hypothetical protein
MTLGVRDFPTLPPEALLRTIDAGHWSEVTVYGG